MALWAFHFKNLFNVWNHFVHVSIIQFFLPQRNIRFLSYFFEHNSKWTTIPNAINTQLQHRICSPHVSKLYFSFVTSFSLGLILKTKAICVDVCLEIDSIYMRMLDINQYSECLLYYFILYQVTLKLLTIKYKINRGKLLEKDICRCGDWFK